MSNIRWAVSALAAFAAMSSVAAAANVRELVMTPGKGVSFYMGSKHGITHFLSENGACLLTLAIGDNPDMEGMNPGASTRITMTVVPGRPAKVETTEGQTLMLGCAQDAQSMTLVMPPDFKVKEAK